MWFAATIGGFVRFNSLLGYKSVLKTWLSTHTHIYTNRQTNVPTRSNMSDMTIFVGTR